MSDTSNARRRTLQRGTSHRWAVALAAAALVAFIGSTGLLLSDGTRDPALVTIGFALGAVAGPLAFAVSAVLLMYSAERVSGRAALWTSLSAVPAVGLTALAQASWAVGFDEADAGVGLSWFGSATLYFVALAWLFGTLTLLAPLGSALNQGARFFVRPLRTVVLAGISAAVLGPVIALAYLVGPLAGGLLLVLALRIGGHGPRTIERPSDPLLVSVAEPRTAPRPPAPLPAPPKPEADTRRRDAAVVAAALTTVGAGLACAVFALTGSSWTSAAADATHAMNLGLGAGALAALPAAVAAGVVLAARYGAVLLCSTMLLGTGLVLEATAQFGGADHPSQWPLTLAAAGAAGFALALPYGRLIRGGLLLRAGATTLLGLAAAVVGLFLVTAAGFIAPPAAAALLVWSGRRLAGRRGLGRPQPV